MMDRREREDLDRHITGNYGEDQFHGEDEESDEDVKPAMLFVAFAGPIVFEDLPSPSDIALSNIKDGIRREIAKHTFSSNIPVVAECLPQWTVDGLQDTINRSIMSFNFMKGDLQGVREMALITHKKDLAEVIDKQIPMLRASLAQGARIYSDLLREMFPAPGEVPSDDDDLSEAAMHEYRRLVDYSNSNGEPAALKNAADTIVKLRATIQGMKRKGGK